MAKDKAGLVDLRSFKSVAVSIKDRGVKKVWSQIGKLSPLGRDELSRLLIANSLVVDEEKGKLDKAEGGAPQRKTTKDRSYAEAMAGPAVGQPPTGAPGKKVSINQRVKSKVPVQEPVQGPVQAPVLDLPTPKTSKVNEKVNGKLVIRNKARKRNLDFRKESGNHLAVSEPVNSPAKRIKVQVKPNTVDLSSTVETREDAPWVDEEDMEEATVYVPAAGEGGLPSPSLDQPEDGECTDDGSDFTLVESKQQEKARRKQQSEEDHSRLDEMGRRLQALGEKKYNEHLLLPARKPVVGVDLPARYFANPSLFIEDMAAKGIKVRETRPTRGGHLLIFAETVGDQGKLLDIKRNDSGYYRRPISAADRDKDSKKSIVVTGVMPTVSEEDVRRSIQENQGLNVTATRLINKASGNSIHKVKVTFNTEEDKSKVDIRKRVMIGNTSCKIEDYKKKTRTLQCFKCQRYGHSQLQCYASERCGRCAGPHSRRDCNSRNIKCANCSGDHMSTDDRCPRATNFRDRINNKRVGQVNRGKDEVRRRGPEKERHISRPAPQRPQKEVSIDSNFSKKNLTRLSISLSTQMLRILMSQESGKLRLEHIPSIINDAVNWAFAAEVDIETVWTNLNTLKW